MRGSVLFCKISSSRPASLPFSITAFYSNHRQSTPSTRLATPKLAQSKLPSYKTIITRAVFRLP